MEYSGYREIQCFFPSALLCLALLLISSQNILMDVRCGSYTSNTDKQFILNAIVHPGQHYGLSILDTSANCVTQF